MSNVTSMCVQKWLILGFPKSKNQGAHAPTRPRIKVWFNGWHHNYLVILNIKIIWSLKHPFKVDVYSFMMVCYEILVGRILFHEINSIIVLWKKVKEDGLRLVVPDWCPKRLSTLIQSYYNCNLATWPLFFHICRELKHMKCFFML